MPCGNDPSRLLSRKSFAFWKRFLPKTMATSVHVHVHDHVNVHELGPWLTLDVDVVVDVHVDVIGFFIWLRLCRPRNNDLLSFQARPRFPADRTVRPSHQKKPASRAAGRASARQP